MLHASEPTRLRLVPLVLACLFALAAGCGGGGGGGSSSDGDGDGDNGGGSGSASVSTEEKVALVAQSAASTAQSTRSFASSQVEDEEEGATTSATAPLTMAPTTTTCDNGGTIVRDDAPGFDINSADFPALLDDSGGLTGGSDDEIQFRADNCVNTTSGSSSSLDGAFDHMARNVTGHPETNIVVNYIGGPAPTDSLPDLDNFYVSETDFDGGTFDFRSRAAIHACVGCVEGKLNDFATSNVTRHLAMSMFLDMEFDDGDGNLRLTFGSEDEPITMMSGVDSSNPDLTFVEFDGHISSEGSAEEACDYDVSYSTEKRLLISDYNTDSSTTQDGRLTITVDGTAYDVEFEADGRVLVDGEEVDTTDVEETCGDSAELETSS